MGIQTINDPRNNAKNLRPFRAVSCNLYQIVVECIAAIIHHRVTEGTEGTQRLNSLCILCVLCDSVVSLIHATLNRKPLWWIMASPFIPKLKNFLLTRECSFLIRELGKTADGELF
jgi:hypothetical protein